MKRFIEYALLLAVAVMFVSCEEKVTVSLTELTLRVDNDVIKSDGNDVATFTAYSEDGTLIKDGITLFDAATDTEVTFDNLKFTTTKEGEYKFWASYKTYISNIVTIQAINADIPGAATDPSPAKTSFVRRMLLSQFTGITCGYCPGMINYLNKLRADENIKSKTILAAIHSYQSGDPAYISSPQPGAFYGSGFPFVSIDMVKGLGLSYSNDHDDNYMVNLLNTAIKDRAAENPATAGISVNPKYAKDITISEIKSDYLIVKTSIKVSESGEYAVGAWLLEDNIYGRQSALTQFVTLDPNYDYDTHNNCVRVADSKNSADWTGHSIGKISAGKTADKTFLFRIKSDYKTENLHLVVFVSKKGEKGVYTVNNVIDCPIDKQTPFEYAN